MRRLRYWLWDRRMRRQWKRMVAECAQYPVRCNVEEQQELVVTQTYPTCCGYGVPCQHPEEDLHHG